MKNKNNGIFISFEGPEAASKSTQLKSLEKFFKKKKIPHLITREPGGTIISEKLRKIILNNKYNISNLEELLLLMTSRLHLINTVIKPALSKGKLVISDRFCDSTFVYQCFVNGYDLNKGFKLHKELLDNFFPHKTFLFLLNPKEVVNRLKKRKKSNKYDTHNILFHKKVIQGYKMLSKNKKRFIVINAERKFKDIQLHLQNEVMKIIIQKWKI